MSTLHDRLVELASDAPPAAPDPLLWERAASFHRRRRVGAALGVAVCAVVVGLVAGLLVWRVEAPVRPAAPGASLALPTRIVEPSPWLPGTDGHPVGPLAALVTADRKGLLSTTTGLVGVSAATGEYRFLDLPDDAEDGHALSQDGRHLAYWTVGGTRLSPNTNDGEPTAGLAIYDTVTGEVVRHEIGTDHGLSTDDGLWWADERTLVAVWNQWLGGDEDPERRRSSAKQTDAPLVWDVGEAAPVASDLPLDSVTASSGTGLLLAGDTVVDVRNGAVRDLPWPDPGWSYAAALDPTGSAVAHLQGRRTPGPLAVTDVRRPADRRTGTVVEERVRQAVAWIDEDHVVYTVPTSRADRSYLESVDVRTFERERLLFLEDHTVEPGELATDLLATPPVAREAPAMPWNPRVLLAGALAVLVVAGLHLWGRWRRVAV